MATTIRVGTRGSKLALTQTEQVVAALQAAHPDILFETRVIKTTGDQQSSVPFSEVGTKGMFVKEIEEALLAGEIDFAVHSLKDMPSELPAGLILACIPERADPRDALLSSGATLAELPEGASVGTGSLRRQAQIRAYRPDLEILELRGNLDTRIRKLDEGKYDAIILACAGLERMGWAERITERIPIEISIPAPGQGALALETREGDDRTIDLLRSLNHRETAIAIEAERGFQAALNAGCTVPAGAFAEVRGSVVKVLAVTASVDGSRILRTNVEGNHSEARSLGESAAKKLLAEGADKLLELLSNEP
jgi:hydroxymethylbilane synthase